VKAAIAAALLLLAGCTRAPDEEASRATIERFHAALNAADWKAIDGLLSQSARNLRPGGGTARAFRAIVARHGRYLGGDVASFTHTHTHAMIDWAARFEAGAVTERFALVEEGGQIRIDSYTDQP
jgi:hypothetical protein